MLLSKEYHVLLSVKYHVLLSEEYHVLMNETCSECACCPTSAGPSWL